MTLFCSTCGNHVPAGRNQCGVCNNGFVSQLACEDCRILVTRGAAVCSHCHGGKEAGYARVEPASMISTDDEFRTPGRRDTQLARRGGETALDVGRFGAISDVTVPDGEAALMGEISRGVQTLLNLANSLSHSAGHTEISRKVIRECRTLATLLQEELETRRGP